MDEQAHWKQRAENLGGEAGVKHTLSECEDRLVIALEGAFTFSDHATFRPVLEKLKHRTFKECVFDLARLDFIDSTGLGLLVLANDICERYGFAVRLSNSRGPVKALLDRAEFGTIMVVD